MTDPVSPEMFADITTRLRALEQEECIRILLAIESGSRAWGFHSPDSDYDVRFIYARPVDWHLGLGKKRDVVERPINDELDISGWELSKALTLALESNAVVAEWLQSPIVYLADSEALGEITKFTRNVLSRTSVSWHYLSLARRQASRVYNADGSLRLKRYFYILRPCLSLRWMRLNGKAMPPMDMDNLMTGCDLSADMVSRIDLLTEQKKAALESHTAMQSDPLIDKLIESEMQQAETWLKTAPRPDNKSAWAEANRLHRAITLGEI